MRFSTRYQIIILLFITLLIGQFGCAHGPHKIPGLPEQARAELGTIGVVSACFEPEFKCPHKPLTKGKAAAAGAIGGALGALYGGVMTGDPYGLALGIVLVPVFSAGGAVYGVIEGKTTKTIKETEETLNAFRHEKIQETLREHFLSVAREKTPYTFIVVEEQRPAFLGQEVSYGCFADKSIDTVLEMSVPSYELKSEKEGLNPPLSFNTGVLIKLIRIADGKELYRKYFPYVGSKRKFTGWAAKNARPLREEFDRSFKNLANEIVEVLFLRKSSLESHQIGVVDPIPEDLERGKIQALPDEEMQQ